MATEHTQGEWYSSIGVNPYNEPISAKVFSTIAGRVLIADVNCFEFTLVSPKEAKANAKLIAAAPDLLKALQEIIALTDRNHIAWDKAKAAIAKATGTQQPLTAAEADLLVQNQLS